MRISRTVEFTPDEIQAMRVVCRIDCNGIICTDCPFNTEIDCVKHELRYILDRGGIGWEEKQH